MKSLYFAYGSNLSFTDLASGDYAGLEDLLTPQGPAWLPDRELAFTRRSRLRNGGVLDVRPRRGAFVHGMLFEVGEAGLAMLDEKEGALESASRASNAYRRIEAIALRPDGSEVPVITYEVVHREDFIAPPEDYLELVRSGRQCFGIDTAELDDAARNAQRPLAALFVYGTLMRGQRLFTHVADAALTCALLAERPGQLMDLGDYPGLVLDHSLDWTSAHMVAGELFRHDGIDDLLGRLDDIEDFRGFGVAGSLYRRTVVDVGMGDGRVRKAWTYVLADPTQGTPIPSRDWRAHRGTRQSFLEALAQAHCGANEVAIARHLATRTGLVPAASVEAETAKLLPIAAALARGDISERQLAQASGRWLAMT